MSMMAMGKQREWKKKKKKKKINVGLGIALEKSTGEETPANLRCIHRASPPSSPVPIIIPRNIMSKHATSEVPSLFCGESSDFQVAGFLMSCHLCAKKLDGVDIYMYRGEKAFCSMECRSWQILTDEYQESCRVLKSSVISDSIGTGSRMFCIMAS